MSVWADNPPARRGCGCGGAREVGRMPDPPDLVAVNRDLGLESVWGEPATVGGTGSRNTGARGWVQKQPPRKRAAAATLPMVWKLALAAVGVGGLVLVMRSAKRKGGRRGA